MKVMKKLSTVAICCAVAFSGIGVLTGGKARSEVNAPASNGEAPRLRRLTEAQYRAAIADIFGHDIKVSGRFEPDLRVEGLLAAGTSTVALTPGGAEQYESIARVIAEQVVDPSHRERLVGCSPGASDRDGSECAGHFFERVGKRLFRRPLNPEEKQFAVTSTLSSARLLGDFHAGLATTLAGMLSDLPFLFQVDHLVPDPGSPDKLTLDGWSRATKLSFFLWNSTPDDELLRAAGSGELMTDAGLSRQVDRLLTSPRFTEGAKAFFEDFLQLEALGGLSKDALIYPAFRSSVAAAAREQTLRTVLHLLIAEHGDYRDMFTSRKVAMNRTLSPLYRMPYAPKDWTIVDLPADSPRVGLLTHISFLALHSHEGRTSPTLRGKALREVLMCQETPTAPANVNFTIVQDTSNPKFKTTRERLTAHLDDEECASCHRHTDPTGLALETFDGAGQFRDRENGASIDTSGSLDKVAFNGAAGLGQVLRDNPAVPQCLVQASWRYGSGRSLLPSDSPTVDDLNRRFAAAGYRVPNLFRAIVTIPAFYAGSGIRTLAARSNQARIMKGQ